MTRDLLSGLWRRREPPDFSAADWELLLSQARRCRLHARVAWWFKNQGWLPDVPAGPRAHLESALFNAERQRNQVRWESDRIGAALADVPTPVVLLKGAAYVAIDLPGARGRLFNDVDILVARETLSATELSLLGAGWVAEALDPYDDRYYRRWMHELPPLKHVWRHTWIDVHHTIAPPTSRFPVDGRQLLERTRVLAPGSRLAVLDGPDMVLHSATHLLQEGDFGAGLRDLLDLDDLLQHFAAEAGFWPRLLDRADQLGLQVPLYHALQQVQRLFGTEAPAELQGRVDALAHSALTRRLMPALLAVALRPPHPSCDSAWTGLARTLLFVRSHWLRMPWYQILPHLLRKSWIRTHARLTRPPPDPAGP